MNSRNNLIQDFLANTEWENWTRKPLVADASNRSYERLHHLDTTKTVILMNSPPERGEDVQPFIKIATHLNNIGLSAPTIHAQDVEHGFLILEDLGDALFAKVMSQDNTFELPLYEAAIDSLIRLHQSSAPADTKPYSPALMSELAATTFDWYLLGATGETNTAARQRFINQLETAIKITAPEKPVLILRDFHAENLIWLPDRTGAKRVGLLDFQDAMLGHPAYDIVSMLEDARRDVPREHIPQLLQRYTDATQTGPDWMKQGFAVQGAQRNLRIIGIFARLSLHYGKPHYVDFIPRVWAHLLHDLQEPILADLKATILTHLPEPSPEILKTLKAKCATIPTE